MGKCTIIRTLQISAKRGVSLTSSRLFLPAEGVKFSTARALFREYAGWIFTLAAGHEKKPTFAGVDQELRTLPGVYTRSTGCLLLATQDGQPAGCVCLKGNDATTCELKRRHVRPSFRGLKIGWQLVNLLVDKARQSGYQRIVLDSHFEMKKAQAIYQAVGFQRVEAPDDFPQHLKPAVVLWNAIYQQTVREIVQI